MLRYVVLISILAINKSIFYFCIICSIIYQYFPDNLHCLPLLVPLSHTTFPCMLSGCVGLLNVQIFLNLKNGNGPPKIKLSNLF